MKRAKIPSYLDPVVSCTTLSYKSSLIPFALVQLTEQGTQAELSKRVVRGCKTADCIFSPPLFVLRINPHSANGTRHSPIA